MNGCRLTGLIGFGLLTALFSFAGTTYKVWTNGIPVSPYDTWDTAFTNIQQAIDYAAPGDEVLVTGGLYVVQTAVVLTKGVAVRSAQGPDQTIISLLKTTPVITSRVAWVSSSNAVLDGFTIKNGYYPGGGGGGVNVSRTGTVQNCIIAYNVGQNGAGAYVSTNAILKNCRIFNNTNYDYGGGVYLMAGLVDSCAITNNASTLLGAYGGGVNMADANAKLRNCLVMKNISGRHAGGIYMGGGLAENCTVVYNIDPGTYPGGGIYQAGGTARNMIVAHNFATRNLSPNWNQNGGAAQSNCVPDQLLAGPGNIMAWPRFINPEAADFRLAPGSPCRDVAHPLAWMTGSSDLAGNPRLNGQPDLGALEAVTGALQCDLWPDRFSALLPASVVWTASVTGTNLDGMDYYWDLDNNGSIDTQGVGLAVVTGLYHTSTFASASLVVSNSAGESAFQARLNSVKVGPANVYVDKAGSHVFPYDTWPNASTSIQVAVNAAVEGSTVWVTNGVYTNQQVAVTNNILLASVNGPLVTILKSTAQPLTIGADSAKDGGALLTTRVRGIAFTRNGTGVVTGPTAFGGVIDSCILSNFSCDVPQLIRVENGAVMMDCLLFDNKTARSGVMSVGDINNFGGRTSMVDRCVFLRNSQSGETWSPVDNTYQRSSAGAAILKGGTVRNCLFRENSTANRLGSVYVGGGILENCTFVNNWGTNPTNGGTGGIVVSGTVASVVRNCMAWGNSNKVTGATDDYIFNARTNNCAIYYSRVTPSAAAYGANNITDAPLFRGAATNDFRLQMGSPGWNAGTNMSWMLTGVDMDGNPRLQGPFVDMGAFESGQPRRGAMMLVR